ncbi:MAG: acetyltransferase [Lachnospiraceae bacterium]|nr:acetyltransferase [Lachnospiraceae bacterium]MCM1237848.1 acetyltransferase [Lachnospiraceae bacterium]
MKNINRIIILGCGGHAKSVCDTLLALPEEYEVAGFVDRMENSSFSYEKIRAIGTDDDIQKLFDQGIHYAILGVGFLGTDDVRKRLVEKLQKVGFLFPTIIDPTVTMAKSAVIGEGTFIGKNAVVNADAHIGKHCIINSCSLIEHDCNIGDFTHIAVSACICGGVNVGKECLVGANATVIQEMTIPDYHVIPAGMVLRSSTTNRKEENEMKETIGGGV